MNRELDTVFFRVEREGKWQNICFSDLTEDEMRTVLKNRSQEWLTELCIIMGKTVRGIGDCFDIVGGGTVGGEEE